MLLKNRSRGNSSGQYSEEFPRRMKMPCFKSSRLCVRRKSGEPGKEAGQAVTIFLIFFPEDIR